MTNATCQIACEVRHKDLIMIMMIILFTSITFASVSSRKLNQVDEEQNSDPNRFPQTSLLDALVQRGGATHNLSTSQKTLSVDRSSFVSTTSDVSEASASNKRLSTVEHPDLSTNSPFSSRFKSKMSYVREFKSSTPPGSKSVKVDVPQTRGSYGVREEKEGGTHSKFKSNRIRDLAEKTLTPAPTTGGLNSSSYRLAHVLKHAVNRSTYITSKSPSATTPLLQNSTQIGSTAELQGVPEEIFDKHRESFHTTSIINKQKIAENIIVKNNTSPGLKSGLKTANKSNINNNAHFHHETKDRNVKTTETSTLSTIASEKNKELQNEASYSSDLNFKIYSTLSGINSQSQSTESSTQNFVHAKIANMSKSESEEYVNMDKESNGSATTKFDNYGYQHEQLEKPVVYESTTTSSHLEADYTPGNASGGLMSNESVVSDNIPAVHSVESEPIQIDLSSKSENVQIEKLSPLLKVISPGTNIKTLDVLKRNDSIYKISEESLEPVKRHKKNNYAIIKSRPEPGSTFRNGNTSDKSKESIAVLMRHLNSETQNGEGIINSNGNKSKLTSSFHTLKMNTSLHQADITNSMEKLVRIVHSPRNKTTDRHIHSGNPVQELNTSADEESDSRSTNPSNDFVTAYSREYLATESYHSLQVNSSFENMTVYADDMLIHDEDLTSSKSRFSPTDVYNYTGAEVSYSYTPMSDVVLPVNTTDKILLFNLGDMFEIKYSTTEYNQEGNFTIQVLTTHKHIPNETAYNVTEFFKSITSTVSPRNDSGSDGMAGWPVKLAAEVSGELILGGLMMVHEREDSITCGPIMPQGGIQALETMLYTLDVVNSEPKMIPNVTIGAHILDDCDKDTYGLEMAVDFIKGSISNIDGAEYHCNKTQVRKVISGVVGAASSVTSIQVANLLRLFRIPQVSFFSTSPELSNKQRFEYFSRTIPSDHYQVKAMVEIVRRMGWSYVSIIYEESNYGIKAFEELETLLAKHDICIAVKEKLVKDSGVAEEIAYDSIVHKLLTKPRARGAIIFGSDQEVAGVMRAVRRSNATGSFSWIGSDGWSARSLVSDGNEAEVEGTLSVQPQANPVRGFEEYFLNLTVEGNRRNPWFVEFWEDHFHCRYPNSSRTPYNQKYKTECNMTQRLHRDNTPFEGQLQFVSDAVMAFAHAFRDMHKELCYGRPGLCDAMKPIKGTELLKYLRKVTFEGLSGDKFRFDPNGDGPARYNIIHFKQMSQGKYQWVKVGEYMEGELHLNMSEIQFKLGHPQPPESVCSLPCDVGQAKKYVEGESCCWHCFNCTQYQIRHPTDETQCLTCSEGTVPDPSRIRCREIPEVFLRPESGWAIGAMSLSSTGILITLFVCGVFMRHNDTPVVRASGRELSYVLLTGILLCYCVTFALVLRPTDVVCGIQRFGAGFCFTVVYAALLTKTNRIARIFNANKRTAKKLQFISPKSQLFICSFLVGVQVLINGVWILVSPPRAVHHYPTREDNHLVCSSHIDASYMIAFGYPIVLIVVCTVYAVLTRKIPEAFNESKHIGFTMYTTCVIWLAFVPLYFGTGNHVPLRITSMSVTISLSASVTLACLFSPKLYIILVHPERNVRSCMMANRYSSKSPAVQGTAQTGSMMAAVVCSNQTRPPFQTALPQQSGSSQGLDSGLQSDGIDLELREDIVHQSQRKLQTCLLVNRSTQTVLLATSNSNNCTNNHQPAQSPQQPVAKLSTTCHIINSSSNGPISVPQSQQKQVKDVQL